MFYLNIIQIYMRLIMLSSNKFFLVGSDITSPGNLHIYKITFSLTSVDWANKLSCTTSAWNAYYSESLLSSDGSTIYSFFLYGPSTTYNLHFAWLSADTGSVTHRFKSSVTVGSLYGSAISGDYLLWILN